jgi:hypothetical protein
VVGGCIEGFRGSNIQIDLRNLSTAPGAMTSEFPVQARFGQTPGPGVLPANVHLTLYGLADPVGMPADMIELARFEVHQLVDTGSPCFIDVGEHVPHPGLHVTAFADKIAEDTGITDIAMPPPTATDRQKIEMATALQREKTIAAIGGNAADGGGNPLVGIRAVTSASPVLYPPVAADCSIAPDLIPPPQCIDDASNQHRLELCQQTWRSDADLWEGTDRVLTAPLHGITRGFVDGVNPVNGAPVGGAQFFVDNDLTTIKGYAVFYQTDGEDGVGTRLLTSMAVSNPTRGVTHVTLAGAGPAPGAPPIVAFMAVFSDLGSDDVHF